MTDKQMIIKRIRDCDNCKFRPETSRVCSDYENCYMVSEYICKLRNQLERKEQKLSKINEILEVYYDDDWKATREIERILNDI